ncbi:unnamed protein product [Paramecium sonneborni]|uniref:Uncharacterized protein n=1 Tax=Paramecium sonneborni TaxID=65129 RepID=A0A8S1PX59_9CILI|nr:unnamed protein product [Paramecium sonneborni]
MSTKRQNQKEKQKNMPTIIEHNIPDIPKMVSSEVVDNQKQFQNDFSKLKNENYVLEREFNFEQIEQFTQFNNNSLMDNNYPSKLIDLTLQRDCKKIQKQNVQTKQINDFQQLQEIQNPNQLERKITSKQSKEAKSQNILNEEIKNFEERIVKYTSEVNQEIKLIPKLSEEWKKKFTFIKKKK